MDQAVRSWQLGTLAEMIKGTLEGPADVVIHRPVPAGMEDPHGITFAGDPNYLSKALSVQVGAIIVPVETPPLPCPVIRHVNPRQAFGMVLGIMDRPLPLAEGIHPTAVISESARIDPTARIGAYVVIEAGSSVGPGAVIHPHCYIGDQCSVGAQTVLYPRVTLVQDVTVGDRCILHAGCVLGADGFGFAWTGTHRAKIPQVGQVILENNVEIGANTCIDRATCGATVVREGTKLDNLVQIGHNVTIGEHTVMAAHVGISGSCEIGSRVVMGGQAALSDHVKVGDDIVLGGRTGVVSDVTEPGQYAGLPAMPIAHAMRSMALQARLPEMYQRLRALERELASLKSAQRETK